MRTYHTAIEEIQLAVARNETASVREIDRLVAEVLASRETACIAPLLCCLDDRFEAQEAMFAIIHAAESFADAHYIPAYRSCREVAHDGRADELMRAYMGGGAELFADEDEKYINFLRTKARL